MAIDEQKESLNKHEEQQLQFDKELERFAAPFSKDNGLIRIDEAVSAIGEGQKDSQVEKMNQDANTSTDYNILSEVSYGKVSVVKLKNSQYGVKDSTGKYIVPFGKYAFIDGFESGLARVRSHGKHKYASNLVGIFSLNDNCFVTGEENIKAYIEEDFKRNPEQYSKWGIINTAGEEVLPCIYDEVWNFLSKGRYSTTVKIGNAAEEIWFNDLNPEAPVAPWRQKRRSFSYRDADEDCSESAEDYLDDALEGYSREYLGID